jgi:Tol biopolymer transport system component
MSNSIFSADRGNKSFPDVRFFACTFTIILMSLASCVDTKNDISKIVYDSDRDGSTEVYAIDLAQNTTTQLTNVKDSSTSNRFPDWSPTGKEIVFVSENKGGLGNLFIVDHRGKNLRQLTNVEAIYENPAWSPDGHWIATEMAADNDWGLYLIRPDGSDFRRLGSEGINLFHPSWSPDSRKVAVVTGDDNGWFLGVFDIETQDLTVLAYTGFDIASVKWSPDGDHFVVDVVEENNYDLYVLNDQGNVTKRLTINKAIDARPEWIGNDKYLAFHSTRDFGSVGGAENWNEFELYLFDLTSGIVSRLTNNLYFDGHPDWCCL